MVKIVEKLKYNSEWDIKIVTRVTFWSVNLWNLGQYLEPISVCPTEGCTALPCTTFIMWCYSCNDIFKYLLMEPHFTNSFLRLKELELWGHCAVYLSVSSVSSFEPMFRKFGMNILPLTVTPMSCASISYTSNSNVNSCTGNAEVTHLPHNVGSLTFWCRNYFFNFSTPCI